MADPPALADLADAVAGFGQALRAAGLPVGPDRVALFAAALEAANPRTPRDVRDCARATLAWTHDQIALLDRVFDAVFVPAAAGKPRVSGQQVVVAGVTTTREGLKPATAAVPTAASDVERLRHKDFGDLTPEELRALASAMAQLRLVTPMRRSRRTEPSAIGKRLALRDTLRRARRTGGDPVRLIRRRVKRRPRRLVVLCDISGSMERYSRALLQLLYLATGDARAEVFSFATRLTRLTGALRRQAPGDALARAGATAPDWSGGTRIGSAVKEFLERYGRAGLARGAVILIISDGWDTDEPRLLGTQMERLSRIAYRIVWANPRTQRPEYQPLAGGMAAAWPYCDAVVSAHSLEALEDLIAALREVR
jgi:uncharacterized protein with von Willebrand factor type A (vWA) domain